LREVQAQHYLINKGKKKIKSIKKKWDLFRIQHSVLQKLVCSSETSVVQKKCINVIVAGRSGTAPSFPGTVLPLLHTPLGSVFHLIIIIQILSEDAVAQSV
jgi:hypothetical protein